MSETQIYIKYTRKQRINLSKHTKAFATMETQWRPTCKYGVYKESGLKTTILRKLTKLISEEHENRTPFSAFECTFVYMFTMFSRSNL